MTPTDQIRCILEQTFEPTILQIEDDSWKHAGHAGAKESGGGHFTIHIQAHAFTDVSRLQSHRKINQALASLFGPVIHALSIHASAPESTQP
ncbi:MAG: BolA family protein [Mariprofundaceae bacterium]